MADVLSIISIVAYVLSGIALVATVFLLFFFKIPNVIGDLSGKNARRSVARLRASNEKGAVKSYKSSNVNLERGKLTETVSGSSKGNTAKQKKNAFGKKQNMAIPDVASFENPETGILSSNKADGGMDVQATTLLNESLETELLSQTQQAPPPVRGGGKTLTMVDEVLFVQTGEVIQ